MQTYQHLDPNSSLFLKISLLLVYFALALSLISLLFFLHLHKPVLIVLVWIACLSAYFMSFYGVVIDKDMIDNVMKTDSQEAFGLISPSLLIFILVLGVLPTWFILKVNIAYPRTLTLVSASTVLIS